MIYSRALVFGLLCFFEFTAYAQGCSDAGFCTLGNLNQSQSPSFARALSISIPAGVGDASTFVLTPAVQYEQRSTDWTYQIKATVNHARGELGNVFGLGDVYLSLAYKHPVKQGLTISYMLGTKLPLNLSNATIDGKPLPMHYQSSLGTIDAISGIALYFSEWQVALGYQVPLSGTNGNTFLPDYWNNNPVANEFPATNDFYRRGDALIRVTYDKAIRKGSLAGGLLSIYHLGEDTYINANISNRPIAIKGSGGLTLNLTAKATFYISEGIQIVVKSGIPILVRAVRPDGLTRAFVISPEILFKL